MRGPRTTTARFRKIQRTFPTSKEAFIFLIDSFVGARPTLLDEAAQHRYISQGWARTYFAKAPRELFKASPRLAEEASNYASLARGWFVITNLSNVEKAQILYDLAAMVGWRYRDDWDWDGADPPKQYPLAADL